jgi:hypothetical protein
MVRDKKFTFCFGGQSCQPHQNYSCMNKILPENQFPEIFILGY